MFKFVNSSIFRNEIFIKVLKRGDQLIWNKTFCRGIVLKKFLDRKDKPAPYPWETIEYNWFTSLFDNTLKRFDQNSKVIVIEGPVGIGKNKLAKELAEELDMKFIPQPTMDMIYINDHGYDMRNLDEKMPDSCKSYDERNFCLDPYHRLASSLQANLYRLRFAVFFDVLGHLLNTGQGVVTVRSPHSDSVFANAMFKSGFMSYNAHEVYFNIVKHTIFLLLRPHLIIYLDAPVEDVQRKIKERGRPHEVDAPGLSYEFLKHLEIEYKKNYLVGANIQSEILMYDWSDGGDVEVVLEDIEKIDFDEHTHWKDPKYTDWRLTEQELDYLRVRYSVEKSMKLYYFMLPYLDAPEMLTSGNDMEIFTQLWTNAPGMKYEAEFDPEFTKDNVWFKLKPFTHREWETTAA